jgi:anti-sigma factor RsiW
MCDKQLLIGYLYGELREADQEAFARHLTSCADCREEVESLGATRSLLTSWAPPEPDLGFQIVRSAQPAVMPRTRWRFMSPAWGLAAAALLVLAVAAAVANLEVQLSGNGLVVRTGWNRGVAERAAAQTAPTVSADDLRRITARLSELETQMAGRQTVAAVPGNASATRMSDADVVRFVRQLINESEQRQQGVLARQILQVNRDIETARRTDFDRLRHGMLQLQGTADATFQRQRAIEDQLVRVGLPR